MLEPLQSLFSVYSSAIYAIGAAATLMLVQLVVADVVAITRKHTPGTGVVDDHGNILFRVSRTVANTNESIGIFVCAILFCILVTASPGYTAYCAWTYVLFRTLYALCYYANLQLPRSICFGVATLALAALVIVGATTGHLQDAGA